ncbi:MAG TPA: hypothetical protein VE988_00235 [Gemmataceae bacterium]|nr:hypothetical protein [Gemmataceae bacterium]
MFESVILLLIQICFVVAVAYVVIWVLGQLGVALPEMVIKIFWIIVVLIVLLLLYRMLAPALSHGKLFGLLDAVSFIT